MEIRVDGVGVCKSARRRVEAVGQGEGIGRAIGDAQALRKRGLLSHLIGNGLVHGSVVVDAIAAPKDGRGSEEGVPGEGDAWFKGVLVRVYQGVGVVQAGKRAGGVVAQYLFDVAKAAGDVQVHQAAVFLGDWGAVLPTHTGIDGEGGVDPPVVQEVGVIGSRAEVLIGVAERNIAPSHDALQEVRKARSRYSGEGEGAAGILLRNGVELDRAEVGAEGKIMRTAQVGAGETKGLRLVAVAGFLAVAESRS